MHWPNLCSRAQRRTTANHRSPRSLPMPDGFTCTPHREHLWSLVLQEFGVKCFFIDSRKRGREGEKHRCERETPNSCLLPTPLPGTKPATQACALTRNWTGNLSVCRMTPTNWATLVRAGIWFLEKLIWPCRCLPFAGVHLSYLSSVNRDLWESEGFRVHCFHWQYKF